MDGDPKDGKKPQVTLATMDADLTAAVQSGDEAHVRARLGGDRKLSEAEALILIKTREEEERIAYQLSHVQDVQTADVHRNEENESLFGWRHANNDWEGQARTTSAFQSGGAREAVQRDGFIYDADGGRTDATYGFHQDRYGTITTRAGDVFDARSNTYTLANGQKGELLTPELKHEAESHHVPTKDVTSAVVRTAEAIAKAGAAAGSTAGKGGKGDNTATNTTGREEVPLSKDEIEAAKRIVRVEIGQGTLGKTAEALEQGKQLPPASQAILASAQLVGSQIPTVLNPNSEAPVLASSQFVAPSGKGDGTPENPQVPSKFSPAGTDVASAAVATDDADPQSSPRPRITAKAPTA